MAVRHGHLAPFLATLQARAGLTLAALGEACGLSLVTVHRRLHTPGCLGEERTIDLARACGATPEELHRVRVLDALDRRALPLPDGVDEGRVAAALAALEGAS